MGNGLLGFGGFLEHQNYGLLGDYLDSQAAAVWLKGYLIPGQDPRYVCMDEYGNIIHRGKYGDKQSPYGWEIDHVRPQALGGSDELSNLRPLHCKQNARLGGLLSGVLG